MSKRQYVVLLTVALVAGLLSGVVSSYFMVGWLIAAQKLPPQVVEQPSHTAKVIRAERFEVVSKDGKIRAVLGETTPSFLSPHLERSKELKYSGVLVGLWILDEEEKIRTGLYTESHALVGGAGDPHLWLIGAGGANSDFTANNIDLFAPHKSEDTWTIPYIFGTGPSIHLFGARGRSVYVDAGENPGIERDGPSLQFGGVFENDQWYYASLSLKANGPSLELRDQTGKPRAVLGSTELEVTRTGATEKQPPSSLVLFDKDGKVIWQAP